VLIAALRNRPIRLCTGAEYGGQWSPEGRQIPVTQRQGKRSDQFRDRFCISAQDQIDRPCLVPACSKHGKNEVKMTSFQQEKLLRIMLQGPEAFFSVLTVHGCFGFGWICFSPAVTNRTEPSCSLLYRDQQTS